MYPHKHYFSLPLILAMNLLLFAVGCNEEDEDDLPEVLPDETAMTADIDSLDDFDAFNVNAQFLSSSNDLTIGGSTQDSLQTDSRSFTLQIIGEFDAKPETFFNDDAVMRIEFDDFSNENDGQDYELGDNSGTIIIDEYTEEAVYGQFEGKLTDNDGDTITVTNGQFTNVPVTVL